jgi:hypothetical protein
MFVVMFLCFLRQIIKMSEVQNLITYSFIPTTLRRISGKWQKQTPRATNDIWAASLRSQEVKKIRHFACCSRTVFKLRTSDWVSGVTECVPMCTTTTRLVQYFKVLDGLHFVVRISVKKKVIFSLVLFWFLYLEIYVALNKQHVSTYFTQAAFRLACNNVKLTNIKLMLCIRSWYLNLFSVHSI